MDIGVLGATGPAGRGLAARLASVGHQVIAGSREAARADEMVEKLRERWGSQVDTLHGATNAEAAGAADLAVIATTWAGAADTAREHADALAGKPVVSMANGVEKVGRQFRVVLDDGRSVAEAIQAAAPAARVVAAFQHVPAAALAALDHPLETDVIVCADEDAAREFVVQLIAGLPNLRGFDGGSLVNAVGLEAFAALLLSVNLRHGGRGTLRLAGVEPFSAGG